jgi:hypothetical protein
MPRGCRSGIIAVPPLGLPKITTFPATILPSQFLECEMAGGGVSGEARGRIHAGSGEGRQVSPPRHRRNELDCDGTEHRTRSHRSNFKKKRESSCELSRVDVIGG